MALDRHDQGEARFEELPCARGAGMMNAYVAPNLSWLASAIRCQVEKQTAHAASQRQALLRRAAKAARRALRTARWLQNDLPHALREYGRIEALRGRPRRAFHRFAQRAWPWRSGKAPSMTCANAVDRRPVATDFGTSGRGRADLTSRRPSFRPSPYRTRRRSRKAALSSGPRSRWPIVSRLCWRTAVDRVGPFVLDGLRRGPPLCRALSAASIAACWRSSGRTRKTT